MSRERTLIRGEVLKRLHYSVVTGEFTRLVAAGGQPVGAKAGCINGEGYRQVDVCGVKVLAHRLAWFMVTGEWPANDIDHENTRRAENHWLNLRPATRRENMLNLRRAHMDSSTGVLGVSRSANGKRFVAQLKSKPGRCGSYIGTYDSLEEASVAHQIAKAARDASLAQAGSA